MEEINIYTSEVLFDSKKLEEKPEDIKFLNKEYENLSGYDIAYDVEKNRAVENEMGKTLVNNLSGIITTGFRAHDEHQEYNKKKSIEYISDEDILKELKRESVQHYLSRNISTKTATEKEQLEEQLRINDTYYIPNEKIKHNIEKVRERVNKKSSHRWNKTKNKKIKKSREIMGEVVDKINILQGEAKNKNAEVAQNNEAQTEQNDYEVKYNRYNEIYFAIYKSDCYLAEAVAKNKEEEDIIKNRAYMTYCVNMGNMCLREKAYYTEENIGYLRYNSKSGDLPAGEYLNFSNEVAKINERRVFYLNKQQYFLDEFKEAEKKKNLLGDASDEKLKKLK